MNVLLIQTDEHRPDAMSWAGHPFVETPNIDRLADRGTAFANAYCNSPLCAPSRASFATGQYVHEIEAWDNARPYHGQAPTWGDHLREHGVKTTVVGRKHFEPYADAGFPDQREPELSDPPIEVARLNRDPPTEYEHATKRFYEPEIDETRMDRSVERTDEAIAWLEDKAPRDEPWTLYLSYQPPHFPLTAPEEYWERYSPAEMDLPFDYPAATDHPIVADLHEHFQGTDLDKETLRRLRTGYYALVTAIDEQIGRVLDALESTGQDEETVVIYTSDHGEILGDHGLWWKCCTYEPAVGIPLVMAGPDVPSGRRVDTPVSLVDLVPTIADITGVPHAAEWSGTSVLPLFDREDDERVAFSEYHAHGPRNGMFMIRKGDYKYVYYPDNPPQLFDLENDPHELTNLADTEKYAAVQSGLHEELLAVTSDDPDAIDERARQNQRARLEAFEELPDAYK
jgi:choline-sulfatase